jgi:phosphate-selective porin OprO/OprP
MGRIAVAVGCLFIPLWGTACTAEDSGATEHDVGSQIQSLQSQIDWLVQQTELHQIPDNGASQFPTASLEGLIQADAGYFHQDAASQAAVGDLQDGSDFRRARIGVNGKAWHSTRYVIEMDFAATSRVAFTDVFAQLDGEYATLRIGRWRQPFGMSAMTSVKELSFIERASTFAFVPFRQSGIGAFGSHSEDTGTWAASVFRTESNTIGASLGDDGGWGLAGRATWLVLDCPSEHRLFHVGANYSLIAPPDDTVQFTARPEAFLAEVGVSVFPAFVDTGAVTTEVANLFGVESGFQYGRIHGQAEFFHTAVDQIGGPSLAFQGAYFQLVYSLSGEPRPYSRKHGVFTRPQFAESVDCGGRGAWEMAARWSWVDLNDENIDGGDLTTLTAGINWYLNPRFKLQFNYINVMHDTGPMDADSHLFVTRAQIDF